MDPRFLTSAPVEVSGHLHALAALPLGERAPGTHVIGGWMDPRAGIDYTEKLKFLTLPRLELRPFSLPARRQPLYRLGYRDSSIYMLVDSIKMDLRVMRSNGRA
jgi:hypothetical protein